MAKNTQTAQPFEAGESNARASRTPETDQVIEREADQAAQQEQQSASREAAERSADDTAAGRKAPRKRAAKGTETGARKRSAGKHRQ